MALLVWASCMFYHDKTPCSLMYHVCRANLLRGESMIASSSTGCDLPRSRSHDQAGISDSPHCSLKLRTLSEPRGSLTEIFSPSKVIKSTSSIFSAFAEFAHSSDFGRHQQHHQDSQGSWQCWLPMLNEWYAAQENTGFVVISVP